MHVPTATRRDLRLAGTVFLLLLLLAVPACSLFGESSGVCVSEPVEFSFGLRVYCQNNFDKGECADWDDEQVNGASWSFHAGQTCADRGLEQGSNPWP